MTSVSLDHKISNKQIM